MTTNPKKNDELNDLDLESVAAGANSAQRPEDTGDEATTRPTGDYGESLPNADAKRS